MLSGLAAYLIVALIVSLFAYVELYVDIVKDSRILSSIFLGILWPAMAIILTVNIVLIGWDLLWAKLKK